MDASVGGVVGSAHRCGSSQYHVVMQCYKTLQVNHIHLYKGAEKDNRYTRAALVVVLAILCSEKQR